MRLQIAGFIVEVNCDERLVGQMPNYLPFIASETEQGDVLCRIDVGCTLPDETTVPDIVQYIDGKELSIWLRSGYCSVSLKFHNGAFLYRLRADRNWTYIQTDWVPGNPDSLWVLNDFIMIAFIYSAAFIIQCWFMLPVWWVQAKDVPLSVPQESAKAPIPVCGCNIFQELGC